MTTGSVWSGPKGTENTPYYLEKDKFVDNKILKVV